MFGMRRRSLMSQPPSLTTAPSMEGMLQAGGLQSSAQDPQALARQILEMAVKKVPQDMAFDANGDGRITSADALMAAKGWTPSSAVPPPRTTAAVPKEFYDSPEYKRYLDDRDAERREGVMYPSVMYESPYFGMQDASRRGMDTAYADYLKRTTHTVGQTKPPENVVQQPNEPPGSRVDPFEGRSLVDPLEYTGGYGSVRDLIKQALGGSLPPAPPPAGRFPYEGDVGYPIGGWSGNLGPDDRPLEGVQPRQITGPDNIYSTLGQPPRRFAPRYFGGNQQMGGFGGLMGLFGALRGYNQPFMGGYDQPFMGGGQQMGGFGGFGQPFMGGYGMSPYGQGYTNPYFGGIGMLPFQMGGFQPQYPSFGGFSGGFGPSPTNFSFGGQGGFGQAFNQQQSPSMNTMDKVPLGSSRIGGRFA